MTEEELKGLILTAIPGLAESVPHKTLKMPSFMLDFGYMETASLFGNGKCLATDQYVQIDLFYLDKTAFETAKSSLKQGLINQKIFSDLESYYDTTNKYYRATFKVIVAHMESEE